MDTHILNRVFDEIIVLSGEYEYDKWRNINQTFIERGIFVTRIEKYKAQERKFLISSYPCPLDTNLPETFYQDNLSLLKVLNYINNTASKRVLILDADVKFRSEFDDRFTHQYNNISKMHWDIWLLGMDNYNKNMKSYFSNILPAKDISGLYAFALNIKNYNNILIYMKQLYKKNLGIVDVIQNVMSHKAPFISYASYINLFNRA